MSRKDQRKDITPFRLHSKQFDKAAVTETILWDWSIQFGLKGWASTTAKDYDGDIILPEWIDLTRYNQNPIVKKWHLRGVENNIGRADVSVKTLDWVRWLWIDAIIILNPEIESHKEVIHGIRHWLVNWRSIWFAKVVVTYDEELKAKVISSCELHEVSLVDIPNNPMTVTKMIELAEKANKDLQQGTDENNVDTSDKSVSDSASTDDTNDDASTKSTVVSEYVKAVPLEQLQVWMMVRYVKTVEYTDWRDWETYCWDYCNNAEVVKIVTEMDEETGEPETDIYMLDYELTLDWFKPTTCCNCFDYNEITLIELSEEQLKDCKTVETKNIEEVEEAIEVAVERVEEAVDAVIEAVQEVVEVIADEESETEIWNDEATKELKTTIEQKSIEIETHLKQIEEKDLKIAAQTKQIEELNAQAEESASAIKTLLEMKWKLEASLEKSVNNYKQLWKLYDTETVKDAKQPWDLLKSRMVYN